MQFFVTASLAMQNRSASMFQRVSMPSPLATGPTAPTAAATVVASVTVKLPLALATTVKFSGPDGYSEMSQLAEADGDVRVGDAEVGVGARAGEAGVRVVRRRADADQVTVAILDLADRDDVAGVDAPEKTACSSVIGAVSAGVRK